MGILGPRIVYNHQTEVHSDTLRRAEPHTGWAIPLCWPLQPPALTAPGAKPPWRPALWRQHIHQGSLTAGRSTFPGCVVSMCSHDAIEYRPQAGHRSKVQRQGCNGGERSRQTDRRTDGRTDSQTDGHTHRANLQPHLRYRLIRRNTFGYSDVENEAAILVFLLEYSNVYHIA